MTDHGAERRQPVLTTDQRNLELFADDLEYVLDAIRDLLAGQSVDRAIATLKANTSGDGALRLSFVPRDWDSYRD